MPGFALAKAAADVFEQAPDVEGLILHKHGIFTFGDSAREAYERMIALVTRAEERLARNRKAVFVTAQLPQAVAPRAAVAPLLRGAASLKDEKTEGAWRRLILDFRATPAVLDFVNGAEVARYSQAGVVTPDHTIRTKNWPLILPAPADGKLDDFKRAARERGRGLHRQLPGLFRAQQCARRRHQEAARSAAARRAGAGARPVRPRALQEGRARRRRSRRVRDRDHHRRRGDRPVRVDLRSRHVRHGILVARTGQARRRQGTAARRPGRGDHRRRRHHRLRDREGVRRRRRRGRAARYRRGRRGGKGQGDRRRGARGRAAT